MKKILALVLAVILCIGLAACSNSSKDATPIKIGVYLPQTGSGAGVGEAELNSMNIAVEKINAAGGINGRNLELVIYDDAGTTEGAVKAVTRLIEMDGVQVIIGDHLSANMLATYSLTDEAKVLQVGLGTSASWTNIGAEYLFRATSVATAPIHSFVSEIQDMGDKNIAVITTEAEYGQAGRPTILSELEAIGCNVVFDETYQQNETEFYGLVVRALETNPDGIVMYGVSTELPPLLQQIRQQGFKGAVYTSEVGSNSDFISVVGEYANGLTFAGAYYMPQTPEEGTSEIQVDFLKAYYEKHGTMVPFESAFRAYDAVCLVAEALRNAKDVESGESIKDAFKAINGFEGIGGVFNYTAGTGEGLSTCNRFMIMDEKVTPYNLDTLKAYYGR